jgi:uncharacterized membrane protein HdeD (DUF308 family)
MIGALVDKWWVLVVRGVFGVLAGIIAFAMPGAAILSIVLVWGVFAEIDGIGALMLALSGRHAAGRARVPLLVAGIAGVLAGLVTWLWPALSATVLIWIVAAWAIGRGIFQVIAAIELRREIEGEWLMVVSGVLSVIFGLVILYQPVVGLLTVAYLVGLYACSVGLLEIGLGLRARQFRTHTQQPLRGGDAVPGPVPPRRTAPRREPAGA